MCEVSRIRGVSKPMGCDTPRRLENMHPGSRTRAGSIGTELDYFGSMTRVWLSEWEWACCGDAFEVGDEINFGIETRTPDPSVVDALGPTLVATVNAIESHHEEARTDRVRGRVVAVYEVTHQVLERRSLRRPGHGAPLQASSPPEDGTWPLISREIGHGTFIGSRPTRFVTEITLIPDTAELLPTRGVRLSVPNQSSPVPDRTKLIEDAPSERRVRTRAGWLIDVEERSSTTDIGHMA